MAYAQGKFSRAICDRCGFDYPYLELRKEWTGFKVCGECYEPKHPQLDPPHNIADPEALYQPRPTISAPTTGQGYVIVGNPKDSNGVTSPIMWAQNSDTIGSMYLVDTATSTLGTITVTTS